MTKVCAIHQPNFLPWLGYFEKMKNADVFVFLDNVDIVTGTSKAITNRTRIKTPGGVQWLTVPIIKSNSKIISDIQIVNNNWRKKILTTISLSYCKSSNFNIVFPLIEKIIKYECNLLSEFNIHAILQIADYLNIQKKFYIASQIPVYANERNQRIIDICKHLNCTKYISGKGGKKYHDEQKFSDQNIQIVYSEFQHPVYNQLFGEFVEGLSIIDVLFNQQNKKK